MLFLDLELVLAFLDLELVSAFLGLELVLVFLASGQVRVRGLLGVRRSLSPELRERDPAYSQHLPSTPSPPRGA